MPDHPGFASRLFVSGSLGFVLIGLVSGVYGVALPAFTRAFDLPPGAAGLVLSTHALGGVLAVALGLAGTPGLTARLAAALMAAGAGTIALGLSWPLTLAGSFVLGAGFGLIAAYVNRAFLSGFGSRGPGMVGLVNAISGLGLIAGPILYVWAGGTPRPVYLGMAVLALLLVPLLLPDRGGGPTGLPDLRQKRLLIVLLNTVSVALEAVLAGFGASALIALGHDEAAAAGWASAFFAAFLLARLALYWLARQVAADLLFLIGTAGTAAATLLAAAGLPEAGLVLAGGFVGLAFPSFYVWGTRVLGPDPRISAAMLLSGLSGGALGPLLFGALLPVIGMGQMFAAVAVTATALAVVQLLVIGPARALVRREAGTIP